MNKSMKLRLLGAEVYSDIPGEITLKLLPTVSELDNPGNKEFETIMLEKIFPQAIEEKFDYKKLLEIDFNWVCRYLRMLNYGPYYTVNAILCDKCKETFYGEQHVDIRNVECVKLPEGFKNSITISKDEFIDFNGDITFKLPTIQQIVNCYNDKAFQNSDGVTNRELARICYMISSIKNKSNLTPVEIKLTLQNELSPSDYIILKNKVSELSNYGLRAGGSTTCPNCGYTDAAFLAITDERMFKPTMKDLQLWKKDKLAAEDNVKNS